MSTRGFSLVESLVAVALLSLVAVGLLPAIMTHVTTDTRNEIRTDAVSAAEQRMEALRLLDPATLPLAGPPDSETYDAGGRSYEIRTQYCLRAEFCPPASPLSRHVTVEVYLRGERIYDVESVYTQLR